MQNNIFFLIVIIGLSCVNAQIEQGDQLMKTGNWKAAIEAYKNESASADKEFRLAQAYNQLGNTFQAIQFYKNGFKNDSVSIKPQYEYGKLLINSQQYVTAIPVFQNLNTSQPENASFYYYLGEAWSGVNQIDLAIQSYKQALSLNEEYRVARLDLIKNYIQKGNFKKAIDIAKQGVAMDSTDVKVNSYLAQAYVNSKWYDKAIPVFEKLFELDNDTEYNRSTLAFSYFSEKEFEKAIENYQIFIKDYSNKKPSVYFHMSVAFMKLEKYPEAIESIEKAITLRRTLLDKEYMQLAAVHARNDDIKNAFNALKMAQKERSDDALINYQLAIAADRYFKDKKAIIPYYEKYLKLHGEGSEYGTLASERLTDLREAVFMNTDD